MPTASLDDIDVSEPQASGTDSFSEPTPATGGTASFNDIEEKVSGTASLDDITGAAPPPSETPLTTRALAEVSKSTMAPAEEMQAVREFAKAHPVIAGIASSPAQMIPKSWEDVRQMVKPPMETDVAEQMQQSEEWGKAIRGEYGPEAQGQAIGTTALQALPLLDLPFAKTPLRAARELVPETLQPRGIEAEIGPTTSGGYATPEDMAAARSAVFPERRFMEPLAEPPPEAAPELGVAPTIEETLAATEPRVTAEGYEGFPGVEAAPEVPIQAETARVGGEQYATQERQIPEGGEPEHIGVPQGENVPADVGEARAVGGEQAGYRGGAGAEAAEPPVAEGSIRFYHGGAADKAGSWFALSKDYAQGYAEKSGEAGKVWYVDVPKDSPHIAWDEGVAQWDPQTQSYTKVRPIHNQKFPNEIADQAKLLGQPAKAPVSIEAELAKPGLTALKNEVTAVERDVQGLSPREAVEARSWDQAKAIAEKEAATDLTKGARLVEELNQKPRALDDVEGVHLLRRKVEVQNEFDQAIKAQNQTPDDVNSMARLSRARDELQKVHNAAEVSGTAWGRGGKIRQAMMAEDFSIAGMEAKARAIGNKGKPLEEPQLQKVKTHYDKISKQEASIKLTEKYLQHPTGKLRPQEILSAVEEMKKRLAPCL